MNLFFFNCLAESYGDYSGSYGIFSSFVLKSGLFSSRLRSAAEHFDRVRATKPSSSLKAL